MSRGEIRSTGSEDEVFGPDPDDRDESEDLREPERLGACRGCDGERGPSTSTYQGWPWCARCHAEIEALEHPEEAWR